MRRAFAILCGFTIILIAWGAVVRGTGSGLGCPDWPLCHGEAFPAYAYSTYIELTHRFLAATVGLLMLGIAIAVWRDPQWRHRLGRRCALALGLLLILSVMGGMAVLSELKPIIIAIHLALAFAFLGTVVGLWLWAGEMPPPRSGGASRWRLFGWLAWGTVYTQAFLGALVSASHAGLACPDFPTCQGQWWPEMVGIVALHMSHRLWALVVTTLVLIFSIALLRNPRYRPARGAAGAVLGLVLLQVALGIGNVLLGLPLVMDVSHLVGAAALFAMLLVALYRMTYVGISQSDQAAY